MQQRIKPRLHLYAGRGSFSQPHVPCLSGAFHATRARNGGECTWFTVAFVLELILCYLLKTVNGPRPVLPLTFSFWDGWHFQLFVLWGFQLSAKESRLQEKYQQPQIYGWYHPNGRKWRGPKEPLDEGDRGEWKNWLKIQHSEKLMASCPISSWQIKGEKVEAVTDFIFWGGGFQNHGRWWPKPWN